MSDSNNEFDTKWDAFETSCRDCHKCDLRAGANNVVIYRGSRTAPLMIVGEAPGRNEDLEGKPFVGQSGELLQNLIGSYGIKESDYHICNIVKCRPPENRRPTPAEIKACKPLFARQFIMAAPKVILLCGSTAYEGFFGVKPVMKDVRGFFVEKKGYYIMTTYHPAYALRNPANKIPIYEDMGKVKEKLVELGCLE